MATPSDSICLIARPKGKKIDILPSWWCVTTISVDDLGVRSLLSTDLRTSPQRVEAVSLVIGQTTTGSLHVGRTAHRACSALPFPIPILYVAQCSCLLRPGQEGSGLDWGSGERKGRTQARATTIRGGRSSGGEPHFCTLAHNDQPFTTYLYIPRRLIGPASLHQGGHVLSTTIVRLSPLLLEVGT